DISGQGESDLRFAEESLEVPSITPINGDPWKILVVDDDRDIHSLTNMVLRELVVDGCGVTILSGYSGKDACRIMEEDPGIAVLLLDVVMESDNAGLEAVRTIRDELRNSFVRIILRTGHAGQAPELDIISMYDINDYREKTDLSSQQLITAVTTALRAFRDLRTIESLASRLKGERETLKIAQKIAHIGNWEWDTVTDQITISDELSNIFGIRIGDFGGRIGDFLKRVHPDDRQDLEKLTRDALKNRQSFSTEYRVLRPDGTKRVVRALGEPFFDGNVTGKLRMIGTVHDISRQRDAEDHLKIATSVFGGVMKEVETQLTLTTKVFESAMEGVIITDAKGVIQTVNKAFTTITGYTDKEAVGNSIDFLCSSDQSDESSKEKIVALRDGTAWKGETWNRRKTGEAYPQWEAITAICDRAGVVTNYVSVFHDLSDIKAREKLLKFRTYHDTLTGLPNRDLFLDRLNQSISIASRTNGKVLVLFLGLDHFKNINNSLGHGSGDLLLQNVASRFQDFIREGDTICRLGGDSFGFVIRGINLVKDALFVIQKLLNVISQPFIINEHELFVTASSGITMYPDDAHDANSLIKYADMALNRAKAAGRDRYQFYTEAMRQQADRRLHLEKNLRLALDKGEFVLYYQPKLSLLDKQTIGMEALVRWQHPETGLIPPNDFIPIAEETGLIIPLGEWILKTACQQTKDWLEQGYTPLKVAVNLSARQFRQEGLVDLVQSVLNEVGLPPEMLELEITESMVMDDVDEAINVLQQLRSLGVSIAVDDFGTGYSSLSYLRRFPIHILKIDQSFVRDLTSDSKDAAIIESIVSLAKGLDLLVVAEGVESREQQVFLDSVGCDEIQGYFYSKPLPTQEFTKFLAAQKNPKTSWLKS
ncbi:MAG: EAL domain-containing protein, partial [Magnetococcales bacterium]|nr:EAL domain-containing protein [Magnetococcales bacterium]